MLKGTDIPYNGPYHIHPTLGPMAGARHTRAVHPQLDYVGIDNAKPTEVVAQEQYNKTKSTTIDDKTYEGGTLRRSSY